jgi:glycogen debranching enzyme
MFFVFDRLGNVQTSGLGEEGLFFDGTRHLSELKLDLWNSAPLLLSSSVAANNFLFTADLSNLDLVWQNATAVKRGTLHLVRSRFLWRESCFEQIKLVNHGIDQLVAPLRLSFNADFADIFEVRGNLREAKGRILESEIKPACVLLRYEGLDRRTRETSIRSDLEPVRTTGSTMEFKISLPPKDVRCLQIEISCNSAASSKPLGYTHAVSSAKTELDELSESFPTIASTNSRFSDWIARSSSDLRMMIVGNPEHNYPYAGVPWFSTVFGRDGIITALQTLWATPQIARGVLEWLAKSQADRTDTVADSEPGKILHEMRESEMAVLGEVPFGHYYGSIDATPLFVMLAGAYFARTADRLFLKRIWPNVERALDWMNHSGDIDGDGFIEYVRHSERGLVQQGWKDSDDSVFHADGRIADPPIALCEVQGYAYAAKLAAARLSRALGNSALGDELELEAEKLRVNFEKHFWCEDLGFYALALDGLKNPCRVRTSNAGHCLFSGIASSARGQRVAETLLSPDFFSGWGIRTVATTESRYNPLFYHNGSVWPHDNSIIASGVAKYGHRRLAGRILLALLDLSSEVDLHRLPELFCGLDRRPGEGPTLYPVACSPQAWSAAAPFMILQACLGIGIEPDAKRIVFDRPYLPEGIQQLSIRNLSCGDEAVDLLLERRGDSVLVQREDSHTNVEVITIT